MTAMQKTLILRPADVSGALMGMGSTVADITAITASYDRTIAVDGMVIGPCETPLRPAADGTYWQINTYCSDDPSISIGGGFTVLIRVHVRPKQGLHTGEVTWSFPVTPLIASPDYITVGAPPPAATPQAPYYRVPDKFSGIAVWTSDDGTRSIPYLVAPSDGDLTAIGAP